MDDKQNIKYNVPEFNGRNIPVKEVAKLMGKDQQFIRQCLIRGILPIGTAFKKTQPIKISSNSNDKCQNRINVTIRRTLGSDINASCGQLRKSYKK